MSVVQIALGGEHRVAYCQCVLAMLARVDNSVVPVSMGLVWPGLIVPCVGFVCVYWPRLFLVVVFRIRVESAGFVRQFD